MTFIKMAVNWSNALLIAGAISLSGCAGSPYALSTMSPAELRQVEDQQLCAAYASYTTGYGKKNIPHITNEVNRRSLDCSEEIEVRRNDCRKLKVVRVQPDKVYRNVSHVTVRNNSAKAKRFRLHDPAGIYGKEHVLAGNATATYSIAVEAKTRTAASAAKIAGMNAAATGAWGFLDCYTTKE